MRIAIIVNSCYKYHEKTLPIILDSLSHDKDVFCIIGESETCKDDGNFLYRTWANMDNNGLIWVSTQDDAKEKLKNYEWIFYIHDTCVCLPEFKETLYAIVSQYPESDAIKLYHQFSMSMGFYRLESLWDTRVCDFLTSTINYDKSENTILKIKASVEDQVFNILKNVPVLSNNYKYIDEGKSYYDTNTKRIMEKWVHPPFYKFKANYDGTFKYISL